MSGGVDSSVSALLLKDAGYDVVGVTMCLGIPDEGFDGEKCCGADAIEDARCVCRNLDIPHYVFDLSEDFREKVMMPFTSEYVKGRTPNPCAECNKHIKFSLLFNTAVAAGASYLATGHYAQIDNIDGVTVLKRAADEKKDQTYFLSTVERKVWDSVLFPVGDLTKAEVREIAREAALPVAERSESQDICFVPDGDYRNFLRRNDLTVSPGPICDSDGAQVGQHDGIAFYTIGQRRGLGVFRPRPLYVTGIDSEKNCIEVGYREELQAAGLTATGVNLLVDVLPDGALAKIRHNQIPGRCRIQYDGVVATVMFETPQTSVTPGQVVTFYNGDTVLGGGVIEAVIK